MEYSKSLFGEEGNEKNEGRKNEGEPWVIESKRSNREGEAIEKLMFSDPGYVRRLLKTREDHMTADSEMSDFHFRLKELIVRGENLKTKRRCSCGKVIELFSVRYSEQGVSISPSYTSCSNESCKSLFLAPNVDKSQKRIYQFKFSNLRLLQKESQSKGEFKDVIHLFRWAFGIYSKFDKSKPRLTKTRAYDLFFGELSD